MKEDATPTRKLSSWQAALSQLPGFPAEDRPRLPGSDTMAARQISPSASDEDEEQQ